jgi:hypothetical protein
MAVTRLERCDPLGMTDNEKSWGKALHDPVYLPDSAAAADAAELIARFGEYAAGEAAARADRSRGLGNVIHFCRWRQIERMIGLLSSTDRAGATLH